MVLPDSDFDGPWKELLDLHLPEVLAFLFPAVHAALDWDTPYRPLDKDLQLVAPDQERASQSVDKLIEVRRRGVTDDDPEGVIWVLIHMEVQSQREISFPERMFRYHARLYDRYRRPIVSLAILGDDRPRWRPDRFGYDLLGCALALRFPTAKLLDFPPDALAASDNLCALVVLAHRHAQATRRDPDARAVAKRLLTRRLYERGYDREQIRTLYRFIDWLLQLPAAVEQELWQELRAFEEERSMTYITNAERFGRAEVLAELAEVRGEREGLRAEIAEFRVEREGLQAEREGLRAELAEVRAERAGLIEEGRLEGLREGLALALESRFGAESAPLLAALRQVEDAATLDAVKSRLQAGASAEEMAAILAR